MATRTERLEELLDEYGSPARLVDELASIAIYKADHVRSSWQDETLGRAWERVANALSRAGHSIGKLYNPYEG